MFLPWILVVLMGCCAILGRCDEVTPVSGVRLPRNPFLVDLTYTYDEKTLQWVEFRNFSMRIAVQRPVKSGDMDGLITGEELSMAVHSGTHMDAPLHFIQNGQTVDQIPIEHFVRRPGVLLDISPQVREDREYAIGLEDLQEWERDHGSFPEGCIILIRTGMSQYWGNAEEYIGTVTKNTDLIRVPGLAPDAARWLIRERVVVGIGIEGLSLDSTKNRGFGGHLIILGHGIFILENLGPAIAQLPAIDFTVSAYPLSLRGGSGAPCRVIAELSSQAPARNPLLHHPLSIATLLFFLFVAAMGFVCHTLRFA